MGLGISLSPGATLLSPPLADLTPERRVPQVYCQTLQLESTGGQGHRQAPINRLPLLGPQQHSYGQKGSLDQGEMKATSPMRGSWSQAITKPQELSRQLRTLL